MKRRSVIGGTVPDKQTKLLIAEILEAEKQYAKALNDLRTTHQKSLNNTYIWCSIAVRALVENLENEAFHQLYEVSCAIPKRTTTVPRDSDKVKEVIVRAADKDLYSSVFVFCVAQVEAFLNDLVRLTLRFDHRKLKSRIQGIEHTKRIDVDEIIDLPSKEAVIDLIIKKELTSLFYAGAAQQAEYLRRVVGAKIEDDIMNAWIEQRASRDLIVHNSGVINDIYLKKCGTFGRGNLGDHIPVDTHYFEMALANMKSLIGQSTSSLQRAIRNA